MDRYLPSSLKRRKKFGQNFLRQEKYINALVADATVSPKDTVLEIGPGLGAVTEKLAHLAKKVIAVEFDRDLIPPLQAKFKENTRVEIINDDILHFLEHYHPTTRPQDHKIVGSLPYQITSPLLHQLINLPGWEVATFLIQKEAAEKIIAAPPCATYLANFVQAWADVKLITTVPKEAFFPVPKVDGAIIKLKVSARGGLMLTKFADSLSDHQKNLKLKIDSQRWSAFLHRGFAHPRKMLNKIFPAAMLKKAQVDPHRRPATLMLEEWLRIYKKEVIPQISSTDTHR
jgi:16S rRNA (adenine1518-N6/adenine1519-N6)-dimethyltransferase